jgi:hypothetical protein
MEINFFHPYFECTTSIIFIQIVHFVPKYKKTKVQ